MTRPRIEISPDVAQVLGAEISAELHDIATFPIYACPICDEESFLAPEPASVIVYRYRGAADRRVRLAHAQCSPSAIVEVISPPQDTDPDLLRLTTSLWVRHTPYASALLVLGVGGFRTYRRTEHGAIDTYSQVLLDRGLQLVTDVDQALEPVNGLSLTLGRGRLALNLCGSRMDGKLTFPPGWRRAAHQQHHAAVITAAGLDLTETHTRAAAQSLIQHAINTGHAVGGVAHVHRMSLAQALRHRRTQSQGTERTGEAA